MAKTSIKSIAAHEILSSGAYPTIETTLTLENGISGIASVPFGVSAGSKEAEVLLDGDKKRYQGKGCRKAISNIEKIIAPRLKGVNALGQRMVDHILNDLDPSPRKEELGGNAILSVSLACTRAAAKAESVELYQYIRELSGGERYSSLPVRKYSIPRPMMVVIEGGAHADHSTDFQEYLICPLQNVKYHDQVRMGIEVYYETKKILQRKGYNTNVGTEGAFAPAGIGSNEEPVRILIEAIEMAGYVPGKDIGIAIDAAASEFYRQGQYVLSCEKKKLSAEALISYYQKIVQKYGILSLEDGLAEDDWQNWSKLYRKLGKQTVIVGDDLTVTNVKYLQKAINERAINAIIIKPNQVGTLTETLETIALAQKNKIQTIVSHRGGGDTNDTFIMDLGVAAGSAFTKVGPSRGERVEKYNRMMRIAAILKK